MIDRILLVLMMIFCICQFSLSIYQSAEIDRLSKTIEATNAKVYDVQNKTKRNEHMIDQTLSIMANGGWK